MLCALQEYDRQTRAGVIEFICERRECTSMLLFKRLNWGSHISRYLLFGLSPCLNLLIGLFAPLVLHLYLRE
jgi:hypothetical protein